MAGTLYVVATPIGNLGDLSARAAETLRQVDLIAAEDTRESRKLADHAGSSAKLLSWHSHSSEARTAEVVELLRQGRNVALVTDAGSPGVSDPGPALVEGARNAGVPVIPIPGPSAVATALMAAGFPADRYLFLGFAPRKGAGRTEWLERIRVADLTVVCFEAPGRLDQLLADLAEVVGPEREAMVGREMTKRFEEYRRAPIGELARWAADEVRGEVTVVIAPGPPPSDAPDPGRARALIRTLRGAGLERSRIAKIVTETLGVSRNESYRMAMEDE